MLSNRSCPPVIFRLFLSVELYTLRDTLLDMRRRNSIALTAAVVAGLVFFLAPLFPYQSPGYGVAGGTWNQWGPDL